MPGITKQNVTSKKTEELCIKEELLEKMRQLMEKLLILDYTKEFISVYKCPPIHRYFFCRKINNQQFITFCCLCSYLLNKLSNNNHKTIKLDYFDDPNVTIDKLLKILQSINIDITNDATTKNQLKSGYGEEIINLLNILCDKLLFEKFSNQTNDNDVVDLKIIYRNNDGKQHDDNNNDNDIDDDDDDDDDDYIEDDDDHENEIELQDEFEDYLETESDLIVNNDDDDDYNDESLDYEKWQQNKNQRKIIQPTTRIDPIEWKMELERVLPQMNAQRFMRSLNMSSSNNNLDNEWRIHLQAAIGHHTNIETIFNQTEGMLNSISNDIKLSLDKIQVKENFLQQNCNTILAEWINVRAKALELKQSLEQSELELQSKSLRLQELNDEDRSIKQSIEEYSLRMTDSSPLSEAKRARDSLKQEMIRINLQIGVAVQILVRHVSFHSSY